MPFEVFNSRSVGPAREVTFQGRPHLAAPMRLIVPGVLAGSKGPLYYPPEELAAEPHRWDGVPLVGYHPRKGGQPVSARSPDVLEAQGLGVNFATRFTEHGLDSVGYFDVERVAAFDRLLPERHRILPRLRRGEPVELSTGLYTDDEPAEPGAVHNGTAYTHVARRHRPDHVAVLPDETGACSLKDGCGVLVNVGAEELPPAENREYSRGARMRMAASGEAMKGGSYPIRTEQDLHNAIQAYGRAASKAAAKRHIIRRARALGLTRLLPDGWLTTTTNGSPYGSCPLCGAPGVMRERRPNGNDTCVNGHTYPSRDAKHSPAVGVTNSEGDMTKKELAAWLVANCDCWKGAAADERAALEALPEAKLRAMKAGAERAGQLAANAAALPEGGLEAGATYAVENGRLVKAAPQRPDLAEAVRGLSPQQLFDLLPPEAKLSINEGKKALEAERGRLIESLLASKPEAERAALAPALNARTLDDLRLMASFAPPAPAAGNPFAPQPYYAGGPPPAVNRGGHAAEVEDVLDLEAMREEWNKKTA